MGRNRRRKSPAGYSRSAARAAIERALRPLAPDKAEVTVTEMAFAAKGLMRVALRGAATISPDPDGLSGDYLAIAPAADADDVPTMAQLTAERRLLDALHALGDERGFRSARTLHVEPSDWGPVAVQTYVYGMDADNLRQFPGFGGTVPAVSAVAAAVHRVPVERASGILEEVHPTRRAHAQAHLDQTIAILDGIPGFEEVLAWIHDHLPPAEPSSLVHGDLMPHNIRFLRDDPDHGIVDWIGALIGDPAFDLAIVTRGRKEPFGKGHGTSREYLAAYASAGGQPVTRQEVGVHELCLKTHWAVSDMKEFGVDSVSADNARNGVRNLLKRL
jgi:aminoglycoside phosphotransferase (APT) family kinase protein